MWQDRKWILAVGELHRNKCKDVGQSDRTSSIQEHFLEHQR